MALSGWARAHAPTPAHYFARCCPINFLRRVCILFLLCLTLNAFIWHNSSLPWNAEWSWTACNLLVEEVSRARKLRLPLRFFLPFLTEVLRNPLPNMTNFEHCKSRLPKERLPVCKESLIYLLISSIVWYVIPPSDISVMHCSGISTAFI